MTTFLRILWQLKWVFLVAGLVFSVWRWHVNDRQEYADAAVKVAVDKVKADWAAETVQEDTDAIAAKKEWDAKIAARDAEIKKLKDGQDEAEEAYQKKLARVRKDAETISRGVTASVRANPHDPAVCSLSDDTFRLLNEQTDKANAAIVGDIAETSACGLQGIGQGCGYSGGQVADQGLWGAVGSLRWAAEAVR